MIKINDREITETPIKDINNISKSQGVYLLISPSNKGYVGSTKDLHYRLNHGYHLYDKKRSNRPIEHAINKYKWKNFKIYLLHLFEMSVSNNEVLALETAYIEYFDTTNTKKGYNICLYGTNRLGVKTSEITKRKLSKIVKLCYSKNNHPSKGKPMTKEHKEKDRLSHLGKYEGDKNPFYGKTHTLETKIKISKSRKEFYKTHKYPMFGKRHSEETKAKLRKNHKDVSGKNNSRFDIKTYTFKNTITNEIFIGVRFDFINKFGLTPSSVSWLVRGKINIYKNWIILF